MKDRKEDAKKIPFGWLRMTTPRVIKLENDKWCVDGQIGQYDTKAQAEAAAKKLAHWQP